MKNLKNAIIIFLIFIINCFCVKAEEAAKHQIIRVIDGDTFCAKFYSQNKEEYHKLDCDNAWSFRERELIKKPHLNIKKHPASCCYDTKSYQRTKRNNCFNSKIAIPNAKESNIQLFFLNPLNQKKPVNRCATDACKALVYNINNAQESIDFAIYGIREQDAVFRALVKAQKRGVNVLWVTDLTEKGINIYPDTYKLMKKIPTYKTDFESQKNEKKKTKYFKYPQTAIMHDKFFVFDDKAVFTGSTNISNTCLTGFNSNVAVLINDKRIAKVYKQEFEQMYAGKFHNQKSAVLNNENIKIGKMNVSVYFSPINKTMTTQVIPLIQEAKEYIYVPAFYLTRRDVIEELIKAKNRGVDVKIIVDETSVKGRYVNINYIKKRGIDLKIERWQGKMHMKSIIIDDDTLVIGSMNFTKQGEYINDENCLIIRKAPILTSAYKAHFLELWNSIK